MATIRAQFTTVARSRPTATPTPIPTPTKPGPTPTFSNILLIFKSDALGFTVQYPDGWQKREYEKFVILSSSPEALHAESFNAFSIWFGRSSDEIGLSELRLLIDLPGDLERLQEGVMELDGSTWNTVQIRFKDINSQTQMVGVLAVLAKDSQSYFMVAVTPEADWDNLRPVFQNILRSFRFLDQ